MSIKLLTEHYLEFLSLKGGGTGSSESTLVKMPYCWKSHVAAQIIEFNQKMSKSHTYRPTHGTIRKRQRMITVTCHSEDNSSMATSSLFPGGTNAKLEKK